ncbi:hypothetical protein LTR96_011596 [Exophiala xenobiotica]|nr:hypothetical protein LTR96_011596 [Exophiala xenobiotica]
MRVQRAHTDSLPIRSLGQDMLIGEIHPIRDSDAFIVSIQPPQTSEHLKRATCDIVLVVDVSGSMSSAAPLPEADDEDEKEAAGLSVLDLVKHAARTILETLGPRDRLGIVTFSDDAKIVQELTIMSSAEKKATWQRIEKLHDEASTNLWAGIRTGLDLFSKTPLVDNVQGLYLLTDGMPNHMCPPQGYVAKLGPMLHSAEQERSSIPTIHTFGFGYQIRSELMQSIAEVGNGSYAFIPDAGMIGTAFVHSVANLYSTLGTSAMLEVNLSKDVRLEAKAGMSLTTGERGLLLKLGNLQYGQSRDLVFVCPKGIPEDTVITATLNYKVADGSTRASQAQAKFSDRTVMTPSLVENHYRRAQICGLLSSLFPLKHNGEHTTTNDKDRLVRAQDALNTITANMQTSPHKNDPGLKSLHDELGGEEPAGQYFRL